MFQIFSGLRYLHSKKIFHRDIKESNILINRDGIVKICDFGLSRSFTKEDGSLPYSDGRITKCYRPPEVLLHNQHYDHTIDVWSAGCIFINLMKNTRIIKSNEDKEVMEEIIRVFGSPFKDDREYLETCPGYNDFKPIFIKMENTPRRISTIFSNASKDAIDLIHKIFQYNPKKRISVDQICDHKYFHGVEELLQQDILKKKLSTFAKQ